MSLGRSKVTREIDDWRPFGEALRAEDKELYTKMMQQVCEYLPSMEVKGDPFPNDALFMGLIFFQHRIIEDLTQRLDKLERKGR